MKGLFRVGVVALFALVLVAGFLSAVMVGAVSGAGQGQAAPVVCGAPVVDAGLNASTIPAEYVQDVQDAARVSGLPAAIIAAQIRAESNWNPKAVSHAGARGIAQFMPGTWAGYGGGKDPFDPHAGIAAQGKYMAELYSQAKASGLKGDPVDLALAGYNAGWGGVMMVGGIPDNGETAQYVAKIRGFAAVYSQPTGSSGGNAVPVSTGCGGGSGTTTGVDDYPFKDLPHCLLTASGGYAGCPAGSQSEFNAFNRECVDFVMWRLNQQLGSTKAPWKVMNGNFRPDGGVLGNARDYRSAWENKGWPVDRTPEVGAVAWFGPTNALAPSGYGHVAIVREVLPDGSYIEEGYNFGLPPGDHQYYTIKRANNVPDAFLHIPKAG